MLPNIMLYKSPSPKRKNISGCISLNLVLMAVHMPGSTPTANSHHQTSNSGNVRAIRTLPPPSSHGNGASKRCAPPTNVAIPKPTGVRRSYEDLTPEPEPTATSFL